VVRVERRFTHPVLKKTVRRSKKYHAHDENNQVQGRRHGLDRGERADLEAEALGRAPKRTRAKAAKTFRGAALKRRS
jgi:hypothetical protein